MLENDDSDDGKSFSCPCFGLPVTYLTQASMQVFFFFLFCSIKTFPSLISAVHVSETAEEIYVCELNQINANLSEPKRVILAIGFLLPFPFPIVFFQAEIETVRGSFVYEVG